MIVKMYYSLIESMPLTIAYDAILEDLTNESGRKIELNYFSFAHAIYRWKRKHRAKTQVSPITHPNSAPMPKWNFRDSNEIPNDIPKTGTFNEAEAR